MEHIAAIEKQRKVSENGDVEVLHSFSPQAWPDHVSQIPPTAVEEHKRIEDANGAEAKCKAMYEARRFLPCHYFDHICGSSTGA